MTEVFVRPLFASFAADLAPQLTALVALKRRRFRGLACIGILARLIITSLVAHGQYAAVGFVLAPESVARYRQLNDGVFAEYYLRQER